MFHLLAATPQRLESKRGDPRFVAGDTLDESQLGCKKN
jgi:hypothetical protein